VGTRKIIETEIVVAARWIIARSASAVMVNSGLTPIERGMTDPSQT